MGLFTKLTWLFTLLIIVLSIIVGYVYNNHDEIIENLAERTFLNNRNGTLCVYYKESSQLRQYYYGLNKSKIISENSDNDICDVYIQINKLKEFNKRLAWGLPSIVFGELYVENVWQIYDKHPSDLGDINYYFFSNTIMYTNFFLRFKLNNLWLFLDYKRDPTHSKENDRKDIDYHYSIGNDFYEYVLGSTMMYTCAIYPHYNSTLEEAQINKIKILTNKLKLNDYNSSNTINVLDIGSGWGYLVSYIGNISKNINITGISLSDPQLEYARTHWNTKVHSNIHFINMDYRDIQPNTYDRIVSVGMLEHVGFSKLNTFMRTVYNALKPGGIFVLHYNGHTNTYPDFYEFSKNRPCPGYNFVAKYIFPNGCLLLTEWIIEQASLNGFIMLHEEYIGQHYSKTLKQWRENLIKNKDKILKNYNQTLINIYEYYFSYAEVAHRLHTITKVQQIFYKPIQTGINYKNVYNVIEHPYH